VCGITQTQERIEQTIARRREQAFVRSGYRALVMRVLVLALAFWLVWSYGFCLSQAHGQGMFPALKDGDLCVIYRMAIRNLMGEKLAAGDMVAYRSDGKRMYGRVAALAGDVLNITEGGSVTVNGVSQGGEIMFPTYARGNFSFPMTIPEGCIYVLGDHRTDTVDSRDLGPVPLENVDGKVITILRRRGL